MYFVCRCLGMSESQLENTDSMKTQKYFKGLSEIESKSF